METNDLLPVQLSDRNVILAFLDDPANGTAECYDCGYGQDELPCDRHEYEPRVKVKHLHRDGSTIFTLNAEQSKRLAAQLLHAAVQLERVTVGRVSD